LNTPRSKNINVAIISPGRNVYSETFIQAHVTGIHAKVRYLYNGFLPHNSEDNELNTKENIFTRAIEKFYKLCFPGLLGPQQKAVSKYLQKHKIQVVFAEYGITGVAMMSVCKKNNIPLIVHFHGLDAYKKDILKFYKKKYRQLFKYATFILAVSQHMFNKLNELGCPSDKLVLNCYGPSGLFFNIIPDYSARTFLAVGRFVEKKAPHLTIEAFSKVLQKHPDAKLIMVGDGLLFNDAKLLASKLNISGSIDFKGALPPGSIIELYKNCTAFVQHSVTAESGDSEGTPLAVLEAGAAAVAVIATAHAGIAEVVVHNETGFLVNEYDVESMAAYMVYILENPSIAAEMGKKARLRIKEFFNLDNHIAVLDNLIADAVEMTN
jgi:colanic acid/amylovoran biosynthesis glycosyltransferase